jgi:hypothetical protein
MKALLFLLLAFPLASSLSCNICLQMTELLQQTTITLAPESIVEQAVYLVCEKKCIVYSI